MKQDDRSIRPALSEQALQRELERAYQELAEITGRLLLANEAAEAALATHDRAELCEQFLQVAERGCGASRAALYIVEGDAFESGATVGLDAGELERVSSESEMEACRQAVQACHAIVLDPALVTPDVLKWIEEAKVEHSKQRAAEEEEEETQDEETEGEEAEESEDDAEDSSAEEDNGKTAPAVAPAETQVAAFATLFGAFLPVFIEGQPSAVLAIGERSRSRPFERDDMVLLEHLLRQFAVALNRAVLIEENQERIRELDALFKISRQITSTLNLDTVLRSVVNTIAVLVENDRAEIVLFKGGKLAMRAVSGLPQISPDQAEIFRLEPVMKYLALEPRRLQVAADDFEQEAEFPGRDVFLEYFGAQEMRSFMALPLRDDQGPLGYLCIESRADSWSVKAAGGDALEIVAAQTTVAIRNAMLYSQMPLRGVSRPMAVLRSRLDALTTRRRATHALIAAGALVLLLLPLLPERAGGPSEVRALRVLGARAPEAGVLAQVMVRGGEEVRMGQPLAVLEDLDLAARLAQLRGGLEAARGDVAAARRANDLAAWRASQIRLAALGRELGFEEQRARSTLLRAPLAGEVLELNLQQRLGQHMAAGESLCTVASLDSVTADFYVPEDKIGRARAGQPVIMKVPAFPARSFNGRVIEVGWLGASEPGEAASFQIRAEFENPERVLRPGMTGVAKVSVGRISIAAAVLGPIVRSILLGW